MVAIGQDVRNCLYLSMRCTKYRIQVIVADLLQIHYILKKLRVILKKGKLMENKQTT